MRGQIITSRAMPSDPGFIAPVELIRVSDISIIDRLARVRWVKTFDDAVIGWSFDRVEGPGCKVGEPDGEAFWAWLCANAVDARGAK